MRDKLLLFGFTDDVKVIYKQIVITSKKSRPTLSVTAMS